MKGVTNPAVKKLLKKYQEIYLLVTTDEVLSWDLNVNLPIKASNGRSRQTALLTELITDRWLEGEFRSSFELAKDKASSLNELEKAVLRNLEREGSLYWKVPKDIIVEKAKTTSQAFMVWQQAKKKDQYLDFLPYLKKIIHLNQIIAEHLGFDDNPYDALLNLHEPELTGKFCREVFQKLQPKLTSLLRRVKKGLSKSKREDLTSGRYNYPKQDQEQLAKYILKKMDYNFEAGRMDVSPHPFTTSLGHFDVRITTRYQETDFRDSLSSAIHEGGHALYEQGINPDFEESPLTNISLGIHESQSRFWENQVGKSIEFLEFFTPIFQAFYQDQLATVGSETLIRLFNRVEPGFIRVEADEVTYNLHIILRFEIENALINNKLKAEDVPEFWRVKMKKYLGVVPKTDREGCLQDVHWSYGAFGYFPTYTLGNLYAAQFTAKMKKELKFEELLRKGELGTILSWLRTNIHQYGSLYWPKELVKRVTGEELTPDYFLEYLEDKYVKLG